MRDSWDRRLGWTRGLVSADPAERESALRRHLAADAALVRTARRLNSPSWRFRDSVTWHWKRRYVLPGGLWYGLRQPDELVRRPRLPYALNFLEWEARHPEVWTAHAKSWGLKEQLLRGLATVGHDETTRARLTALVLLVVARPYRCKDRHYVGVARAVDGPALRAGLAAAAVSSEPWARLHATYVLKLLADPGIPNTRATWTRHLAAGRAAGHGAAGRGCAR